MVTEEKGYILFGILNWGLGHATRCVPLIKSLMSSGYKPVLASDGMALQYLIETFPELPSEELPGYNIRYSKGVNSLFSVALQSGKIIRAVNVEKRKCEELIKKYEPAGIISDNRLGFYHKNIPSVYITHQLKFPLPFARASASRVHHRYINNFNECWIPDFEGEENLGGEMTHSLMPVIPVKYIGPLSRFEGVELPAQGNVYDAGVILSGPEPQRTILEEKLITQLAELTGSYILVRGLLDADELKSVPPNVHVVNFADSEGIQSIIRNSTIAISRSGYSSIMDYCFLMNRALLIPTPGQPEQEYLARYMLHKGYFNYTSQNYLNLEADIKKALEHPGIQLGMGVNRQELFGLFERK